MFGLIFFIAGLFFFWFAFLEPLLESQAARSWPDTEAKITDSELVEHDSDEGSSWSVKFTYSYVVNGKQYQNDRYSFLDFSGSRRGAQKLQQRHPIGSTTQCFYDPADPANSVLNRQIGWRFLIGLLPLLFIVVGGGLFYGAVFRGWGGVSGKTGTPTTSGITGGQALSRSDADSRLSGEHPDDRLDRDFDGPLKLKPAMSKWAVLGVAVFFCLFWNGIVSVFVFNVVEEGFPIFLTLFLIPFVLVGLGIIVFCVYTFLSLFNPKIEVALSNGAVPLGSEVDVAWEIAGKTSRIRNLDIYIQGEESATYRRGTDTHTDTNTFAKINIASTSDQEQIQFGTTTITIPPDTMHSLDAGNNKINWTVQVKGDIPWWPDIKESLVFRVRP